MKYYNRTNTDTTRFLVPLLGYSKGEIINDDFINAFLFHSEIKHFYEENEIMLVYTKLQPKLELDPLFRYEYVEDEGFHYYIAEIPLSTYNLFIEGKYSQFDYIDKQQILNFWGLRKDSRMHNILLPRSHTLEQFNFASNGLLFHKKEVWFKPDTIKETFIPSKYETTISNGA